MATIFSDNFESGQGDWTTYLSGGADSAWQLGTPSVVGPSSPHSGSNCWGTNIDGDYGSDSDSRLTSPEIDLTDVTNAELSFWLWIWFESGWDGGILQITTNGGTDWSQIPNSELDPDYDAILDGGAYAGLYGWTGNHSSSGWIQYTVDLSAYEGNVVQLRFCIGTDTGGNLPGLYVDDFIVTGDVAVSPSGTTDGLSVLSGTIIADGELKSNISAISELSGTIKGKGTLIVNINVDSQLSAILKGKGTLTSETDGSSSILGNIYGKGELSGEIVDTIVTVGGTLGGIGDLYGDVVTYSELSGMLQSPIPTVEIIGQSIGETTLGAIIKGIGKLSGEINGGSELSLLTVYEFELLDKDSIVTIQLTGTSSISNFIIENSNIELTITENSLI